MANLGRTVEMVGDVWLSGLLGGSASNLKIAEQPLNEDELKAVLAEAGPDVFASVKVPSARADDVRVLERAGFRLTDLALSFAVPVAEVEGDVPASIRSACPEDRDAVVEVARTSFVYSRFHLDPLIPVEVANEIKGQWAGNYFSGNRGDGMIVAEVQGTILGFLQYLVIDEDIIIDLIGVASEGRRCGLAKAMICRVAGLGQGRGLLRVGTQAANVPSMRLYESMGFQFQSSQCVMHFHGAKRCV